MSNGDFGDYIELHDDGQIVIANAPPQVEFVDIGEAGPPVNLGNINFSLDPAYAGLSVIFGPGPLPDPEDHPNTIYFALPPPPP